MIKKEKSNAHLSIGFLQGTKGQILEFTVYDIFTNEVGDLEILFFFFLQQALKTCQS